MGSIGGATDFNRNRYSEDQWKNTNQNTNTSAFSNTNSNTASNTSGQQNDLLSSLSRSLLTNNQATTGRSSASFDSPQGQSVLNSLTGQATNGNGQRYTEQAANTYGRLTNGDVNPYTEDVIQKSNAEAEHGFNNKLAQTRAGAYRGGTANNVNQQGQLAADFSAQQGASNANLRQGAYNDAQTLALGGASGLGSLGAQQQGLGTQLLSMLRGETTSGNQMGTQTGSQQNNANNQSSTSGNTNMSTQTQTAQQVLETIIAALTGGTSGTKSGSAQNLHGSYSFGGMGGG